MVDFLAVPSIVATGDLSTRLKDICTVDTSKKKKKKMQLRSSVVMSSLDVDVDSNVCDRELREKNSTEKNRLVSLVVKASASRAGGPGLESR